MAIKKEGVKDYSFGAFSYKIQFRMTYPEKLEARVIAKRRLKNNKIQIPFNFDEELSVLKSFAKDEFNLEKEHKMNKLEV